MSKLRNGPFKTVLAQPYFTGSEYRKSSVNGDYQQKAYKGLMEKYCTHNNYSEIIQKELESTKS